MNNSTVFSKLDVKWAFHQIELKAESREITTFVTHKGCFKYKRLMFGLTCAPEMYQMGMQQTLQGCEGVHHIADDIIVHASNHVEHDKCLDNVVRVLRDKGLTLNRTNVNLIQSNALKW
jgi:ribosome-interacting GTPase 1